MAESPQASNQRFAIVPHSIRERYQQIGPTAVMVYVELACYVNKDRACYPSWDTIADTTGLSARTVARAVRTLEESGLIEVMRQAGKPNRYRLPMTDLSPLTDLSPTHDTSVRGPLTDLSYTHDTSVIRTITKNKNHRTITKNKNQEDIQTNLPGELFFVQLLRGWESLRGDLPALKRHRRTASLETAWRRAWKHPEPREVLEEPATLLAAVREQPFVHDKSWFGLPWLLRQSQDRTEWNCCKVAGRNYVEIFNHGSKRQLNTSHAQPTPAPSNPRRRLD